MFRTYGSGLRHIVFHRATLNIREVEWRVNIIKVVVACEVPISAIVLSKVFYPFRFANAMILARHMIWHEVHNNFQAYFMRTVD